MSYQYTHDGIKRLSDNAHIPIDNRNYDYLEYLQWVTSGGVTLPLEAPSPPVKTDTELILELIADELQRPIPTIKQKFDTLKANT